MMKFLKKWALEQVLSDATKKLNIKDVSKEKIAGIWEVKKDEIVKKIIQSIEKIVLDAIIKSLKEHGIELVGNKNGQIDN